MTFSVLDFMKKANSLEKSPRGEGCSHYHISLSRIYAHCRFAAACTKILADNDLTELVHLESAKYEDIKFSSSDSAGILFGALLGRVFFVVCRKVSVA